MVRDRTTMTVVNTDRPPRPPTSRLVCVSLVVAAFITTLIIAATVLVTSANAKGPTAGPYVALGDSYTAGILIPNPTGDPASCLRSTNSYPFDVARAIKPSAFSDVSCSGATTADMTQSQSLAGGLQSNAPQFDVLRRSDALVTLGIGGNDADLIGVVEECVELDLFNSSGDNCKAHYTSGKTDTVVTAIDNTGPKVAAVLAGINKRAPHATVLVVGYPDVLSPKGTNCYPIVPLSSADVKWFNSLIVDLNAMLEREADSHNSSYVNTYKSSIGHDACAGSQAWVNGLIPTSVAAPLHPNRAGETNMAEQTEATLRAINFS